MVDSRSREPDVTHATGFHQLQNLFRTAANIGIDKQDVKRYEHFVNLKIYDLLVRGEAMAKANQRDVIEPIDLPITKGLQECIQHFTTFDADARPILERVTEWPPLDLSMSDATTERLSDIAGGIGVALARVFKAMDPDLKNPQAVHWQRGYEVFAVLL